MNNPFKKKPCENCYKLKYDNDEQLKLINKQLDTIAYQLSMIESYTQNKNELTKLEHLSSIFMQAHMSNSAPYSRITPEAMVEDSIRNAQLLLNALRNK